MPKFSAQHYEAIAAALNSTRRKLGPNHLIFNCIVTDLIRMFEDDNPKFSVTKFLNAIGDPNR